MCANEKKNDVVKSHNINNKLLLITVHVRVRLIVGNFILCLSIGVNRSFITVMISFIKKFFFIV